ncbi:MAG: ketoacyl-ACP synthase III [Elusimicrobia bacterium]|nr:ketoacyl-ACP synthase III [Elusimicrobiota bacterium]
MPRIAGTGMYLPKKQVSNEELFERFGREKLADTLSRIGHGARYHSAPAENAGTHAIAASRAALEDAKVSAEELDLLIVATDTPAFLSPATASYVQHELGAKRAGTFDVNCACAAFVTGVDIAVKYAHSDPQYRTSLVVGTYAMSKFLDPKDSGTYPLFGDGAGAVVLRREDGPRSFLASTLIADGAYWDYMGIYGGGSAEPAAPELVASGRQHVRIQKRFSPSLNLDAWPGLIRKTLGKCGLSTEDVALFVFTQIRLFTIEEVMKSFGLPFSRTHVVMDKWGYTGSACVPMVLHDALAQGKVKRGENIVLCASGGGYAMACLAMKY